VWLALDFDANRKAALDANWSAYSIVHFATHALLNARHPELSGIVLSLVDAKGDAEDGFLRMNDIYNLRMRADLVVLSVCDSAVGKSVGAEGASNLARAFFHAGAHRVVASLWPVNDRASVAFMRAFYRALLEQELEPAAALQEAQRELRRTPRWRAPYYWSGFVLQGDWR
jgi:CHAT domain-containing protein